MAGIRNIGMIGAGKLAGHLVRALRNSGINVSWIWSPSGTSAISLSSGHPTIVLKNITDPLPPVDLIFACIPDHAMDSLLKMMHAGTVPVVHTSGSLAADLFSVTGSPSGVFYPMQSFSADREIKWQEVPVFVEATTGELLSSLTELASRLSGRVIQTTDDQRLLLHISAVFACNFSNHMYAIAEKLLSENGLDFSLLHPLIVETAAKATGISPVKAQTGPAARKDLDVLAGHKQKLSQYPSLAALYEIISNEIIENSTNNE